MTRNRYSHVLTGMPREAADALDRAINAVSQLPRGKNAATSSRPPRIPRIQAKNRVSVPGEGFEPSRGLPRRILSAVRLPFRHPGRWNNGKFTAQNLVQNHENP